MTQPAELPSEIDFLLSPQAVRERSQKIFDLTVQDRGEFTYHPEHWDRVTEYVATTIREKYPQLQIPFHSRLGHFRSGGIDRIKWPELGLDKLVPRERVKLLIDLIVPSVLLDAGAGDSWQLFESKTGQNFNRSEGLGIASFYLFLDRKFSSNKTLTTDAEGLMNLTESDLKNYFQVNESNKLIGLDGRLRLLQKLGKIMSENPLIFPNTRPSDLFETFSDGECVDAVLLLKSLLKNLGGIWPSRLVYKKFPLGDTWSHPLLGATHSFESFVPFHKLSQWLSYSILEACLFGNLKVNQVEQLTGLPEYRNGGLFIDLGLIELKNKKFIDCGLTPEMPVTIEWRALTINLLDQLAERIQRKLQMNAEQLPLAKVLEGGSWWAGRKIAASKRPSGSPPVKIISDGTVF